MIASLIVVISASLFAKLPAHFVPMSTPLCVSVNGFWDVGAVPSDGGVVVAKAGDIVANHMIPIRIAMIAGKKNFLMIV